MSRGQRWEEISRKNSNQGGGFERSARTQGDEAGAYEFSLAGRKLAGHSGILELMDDLGRALTLDPQMRMLGGGNPAAVPEFQALVRERMRQMLAAGDPFDRMLLCYDSPQGNPHFISALAELLRKRFGWGIGPENIAVTSGGQSAFFYLLNLFGGMFEKGFKKILLPLAPEYIGYADIGLAPDMFVACQPAIEWPQGEAARIFKYRIDFSAVEDALARHAIGAIAVSRPTNPSGNVLTDAEVARLSELASARGVPLLIDNAYGAPFPGVIFVPATPFWGPNVVLTLSLSKLGLPGTRTGIVIAPEKIASAVSGMTAVIGLANGNVGQQIVLPWIQDGSILDFPRRFFRPFYEAKSVAALAWGRECLDGAGVDWALHAPEGAFFHWLWLRGLRVSSRELYERLKGRHVLTVPGEYFFFGLEGDWAHSRQCLRLNISQPEAVVREGLKIIAEQAARAG